MTNVAQPWHLFEAFGVEIEYMIVDAATLDVAPIADQILTLAAGELTSDFEDGAMAWSNELALHVLELKTNGPASSFHELDTAFQQQVRRVNQLASSLGAKLMPTGMHPWMDPVIELKLWPHENNPIYDAYNRIFDCRGHGWANLQSTHLNLPFAGDEEFARLHAAIRLLLPIMPALSASSPIADSHLTGHVDYRLEVYRHNSARIPSIAGRVIPEAVFSEADYDQQIFQRTYRDIAPYDPQGILQFPFLNSRGAIARFERGSIEIRVLDVQECPAADIAVCEIIARTLEMMTQESYPTHDLLQSIPVEPLANLFLDVIRAGERAVVSDPLLLRAFGISEARISVGEIWHAIVAQVEAAFEAHHLSPTTRRIIRTILDQGCLARRIIRQLEGDSGRLPEIYDELCDCLQAGTLFGVE